MNRNDLITYWKYLSPWVKEPIRYFCIGGLTTIIQYGIYLLLNLWIWTWLAFSIGYGVNLLFNYFLHHKITFKTQPTVLNGLGYALSKVINYFIQIGLLHLFISIGLSEQMAPIPVFIIAGCINFLLLKFFFNKL